MMNENTFQLSGMIAPADLFDLRDWLAPGSAVFPQEIDAFLQGADAGQDITLKINSPGGYCDAGNAMIIAIRDWCARTGRKCHVEIGAQAASMAACMMFSFNGTVKVHRNSVVMLHGARVELWETAVAETLRDTADALDVINDIIVDTVAEKTERPRDEIASWITGAKETWFGAKKLLEYGLVDGVIDAAPSASPAVSAVAMTRFARLSACKRDGGLLAAVAFAAQYKEAAMAEEEQPAAEVEETPAAEATETTTETVAAEEEKPAEETPPEEEETPAGEEAPAEEEEKPEGEETTNLAETVAAAVEAAVAQALTEAKAEIETLKSQLTAMQKRAEIAEGSLAGLKAARGKPLVLPKKAAVPATSAEVKAEWVRAVKENGYDGARAKFPDLFEAAKTACSK